MTNMPTALETLFAQIQESYAAFNVPDADATEQRIAHRQKMVEEFNKGLGFTEGKKYIRITQNGSVWGFVVNIEDDPKFRRGDILKPAGWKAPARNAARGNVFDGVENVEWTGATYLR